jgi:dTDP-4-dehydrorhamnose 3,5-epimerase
MLFTGIEIPGAFYIDIEKRGDDRGFFARYFCEKEFAAAGLHGTFPQINNSFSASAGTCRGLHYQLPPSSEVKVVRCIQGAVLDLIVDMRPDSPTFLQWHGATLTAENRRMFYVPAGCAHGLFSLKDNTEVIYQSSQYYHPESERGLKVNDERINISLPFEPVVISEKDMAWPDFDPAIHGVEMLRGML